MHCSHTPIVAEMMVRAPKQPTKSSVKFTQTHTLTQHHQQPTENFTSFVEFTGRFHQPNFLHDIIRCVPVFTWDFLSPDLACMKNSAPGDKWRSENFLFSTVPARSFFFFFDSIHSHWPMALTKSDSANIITCAKFIKTNVIKMRVKTQIE